MPEMRYFLLSLYSESVTDFFFTRPEGTASPSGTTTPPVGQQTGGGGNELPNLTNATTSSSRGRSRAEMRGLAMTQGSPNLGATSEGSRGSNKQ